MEHLKLMVLYPDVPLIDLSLYGWRIRYAQSDPYQQLMGCVANVTVPAYLA